ncbi:MAG: hypothetical protein RSB82_03095 [Victivallaceae bacterium]
MTIPASHLSTIERAPPKCPSAEEEIERLRRDIDALKATKNLVAPQNICSGPAFLNSCLMAIIIICTIGIVLSVLGLVGVLPQILLILGAGNLIWLIISLSMAALLSFVFAVSMMFFYSKYIAQPKSIEHIPLITSQNDVLALLNEIDPSSK